MIDEDRNKRYDFVDEWVGRLLSFLAGIGFVFTCIAAGMFFGGKS